MEKHHKVVFRVIAGLFLIALTSCYKKDEEEFNNVKYNSETDLALSIFNTSLSINDSLSFIPNHESSGSVYFLNQDIQIGDSVGFKLSGYTVKEAELKLYLKNNFPVEGYLQVYFMDVNNHKIDSLFTTNTYQVSYNKNAYTVDEIYLKMDAQKLKRIVHCYKVTIVYSIKMNSSVTDHYSLFIGCGAVVKTEKSY